MTDTVLPIHPDPHSIAARIQRALAASRTAHVVIGWDGQRVSVEVNVTNPKLRASMPREKHVLSREDCPADLVSWVDGRLRAMAEAIHRHRTTRSARPAAGHGWRASGTFASKARKGSG